jgi:hypothetical protein
VAARAKNKMAHVGSLRNGCATISRSQPSHREMPRDKSELEAESLQNPPDLENRFLHNGCVTLQTVALRRAIFKGKKGSQLLV